MKIKNNDQSPLTPMFLAPLRFFNRCEILKQISLERLVNLLDSFSSQFALLGVQVPAPSPATSYDAYLAAIASVFSCPPRLPLMLYDGLLLLEQAAVRENDGLLSASLISLLSSAPAKGLCTVDWSATLWFSAPTALLNFPGVSIKIVHPVPVTETKIPDSAPNLTDQNSDPNQPSEVFDQNPNSQIAIQKSTDLPPGGENRSALSNQNSQIAIQNSEAPFLDRLAQLSPIEYDRAREEAATTLSIRKETLDAEVDKRRTELNDHRQAVAVVIPCFEPWPEPVSGPKVLAQVAERFSLHCLLPAGATDVFTLWTATTHAFTAFAQSPRLNLSSPEPGCGKTTALDVIASMAARAVRTENLTAPVLFRIVDQHQPTLLLDEVDTYIYQSEELRGLLNAGHKRGACAYRCEGNTVRAFAPAALAGIGALPGTLHDRSIVISLVKALPGEIALPFDEQHAQIETVLGRKLARWAKDNFATLQACNPVLPATAFNRLADNWRPLFAIAQIAGGDWPQRALDAFQKLTAKADPNAQGVALLADIRQIFIQSGQGRMFTRDLLDALCALPDRPWRTLAPEVTTKWLAQRLQVFGAHPFTMRIGEKRSKGYDAGEFDAAFARLLPPAIDTFAE